MLARNYPDFPSALVRRHEGTVRNYLGAFNSPDQIDNLAQNPFSDTLSPSTATMRSPVLSPASEAGPFLNTCTMIDKI